MREVCDCCNGCSACIFICPVHAISLKMNLKGFYQAYIEESICINCGKCKTICHESKKAFYNVSEATHYVAVAKDRRILKRSSSGGVSYVLAAHMIYKGGKVCAVSYNTREHNAQHYIFTNDQELAETQGSKYLQSNNVNGFLETLQNHDMMMVVGTPCQIAGFREVIKNRKDKDRFLLVDIFCHGVPSTKLWRNHLYEMNIYNSQSDNGKPLFRKNKNFLLIMNDYKKWYNQDAFFMLYLKNKFLNSSCYICPYRRKSSADIRLGDLMSKKYRKLWYSPSCICVNTSIGMEYLKSVKDRLDIFEIEYNEIDQIQQNGSSQFYAENYNSRCERLNEPDITPKKLLGGRYYINYAKSFIKVPLILLNETFLTDNLETIVLGKN